MLTTFHSKFYFCSCCQMQKLREIVEPFGPIESVTIIKNHHTQKSKGCGFVKFEFREDAMEAFLSMKQTHRRWVIEWATSTNESELMTGVDKHNIFVGGLNPTQITKELLQERFEGYGPIESISLVKKDEGEEPETGIPRSAFAFVRFKDASSSASAIEQENGTEWLGKRIRVQYCESADMKGRRRLHQMPGASPYTMGMMVAPPVPAANAYLQGGTHYFTYPPATSFAPAPPPMIIPQQMGGNVPLYIPPSQPTNMPPPPTAPSTPLHKFHPYNRYSSLYPLFVFFFSNISLIFGYLYRKFFAAQTGEVVPNYSYPTSSATSSTPTSTISPTTGVGGTPSSSSGGISYSGDSSGGGYQMGYTHPTYAPYSTTTMYMAPPTTSFSDSSSTGQAVSSTSSLLSSDDYHHLQQQQQQGFVEFDAMYSSSISSTSSGNVEGGGYQLMTEQHQQQQQQSMYHQLMPPPLYFPMPPPTAQTTTTGFPSEYQFHAGGMNARVQQQQPPPEKEGRTGDRTSSSIPSSSSSSSSSTAPPTSSFAQLSLKENTSSSTNTSDNKSLSPVQSPNHSTKGLPC
ncbi:Flowering time control protein FCA, variant 2 [Balamuthia mandrillaris]